MKIKLETWGPTHDTKMIDIGDLDGVYAEVSPTSSPTFTWNDLGDEVLIVSVGEDYSTVSMLNDSTWYYLQESDAEEPVEIDIAGQPATVPNGVILGRNVGLRVLKEADDFPRLLTTYSWREQ